MTRFSFYISYWNGSNTILISHNLAICSVSNILIMQNSKYSMIPNEDDIDPSLAPDQAEKIRILTRALRRTADTLKAREERLLQAEQQAWEDEEYRRREQEAERQQLEAKKKEEEARKEARAKKDAEALAADPCNTSLGEEGNRILWIHGSQDLKLKTSETSFNKMRRDLMKDLKAKSKPTNGEAAKISKDVASLVSFRYDSKMG